MASPGTPFGTPNQQVDINDVFGIILGFQGVEFPGPAIELCPVRSSERTCGTSKCFVASRTMGGMGKPWLARVFRRV